MYAARVSASAPTVGLVSTTALESEQRWESQRSFDELGRPLRDITFTVVDLETTGGSAVDADFATVGTQIGSSGTVRVSGATFTTTANLIIGNSGTGTLDVVNGSIVSNAYSTIASNTDSIGSVLVSGSNSKWLNATSLTVAGAGTGTLQITSGASVKSESGSIGSVSRAVARKIGSPDHEPCSVAVAKSSILTASRASTAVTSRTMPGRS